MAQPCSRHHQYPVCSGITILYYSMMEVYDYNSISTIVLAPSTTVVAPMLPLSIIILLLPSNDFKRIKHDKGGAADFRRVACVVLRAEDVVRSS